VRLSASGPGRGRFPGSNTKATTSSVHRWSVREEASDEGVHTGPDGTLVLTRLPSSACWGHTGATSGPRTTRSQRTIPVTTGLGSALVTNHIRPSAAGRCNLLSSLAQKRRNSGAATYVIDAYISLAVPGRLIWSLVAENQSAK
jgi:hypothetical protein